MDDLNAFDSQLASAVRRRVGPPEPVDDLAIFNGITAATSSQRWGFTMFSAVKVFAASVVVALFGSFLLVGVLTSQQGDEMAPAAVTASPTPTTESDDVSREAAFVSGSVGPGSLTGDPVITFDDEMGAIRSVGEAWTMELSEMDDARLNGTFQVVWNKATYDGGLDVVTVTGRIDNESGSWTGVEYGYRHPDRDWNWQGLYEGHGSYEGLSALLFWQDESEAHGVIFPGTMPEALDAPEAVAPSE